MKLSDYVELYYQYNRTVNDFSIYSNKKKFEKHVYPFLHNPDITSITCNDIINLIARMEESMDHNSSWGIFRELRKILAHAKEREVIKENPCANINYYFIPLTRKPFTEEELKKINEAIIETPAYRLYQMTLLGGLKLTELIVLTWNDISFIDNLIYINRRAFTASRPTKLVDLQHLMISHNITPEIRKILDKQLAAQFGMDNPLGLVFTSEKGRYFPYIKITESNKYVQEKTGIAGFSFQMLETHYKLTNTIFP